MERRQARTSQGSKTIPHAEAAEVRGDKGPIGRSKTKKEGEENKKRNETRPSLLLKDWKEAREPPPARSIEAETQREASPLPFHRPSPNPHLLLLRSFPCPCFSRALLLRRFERFGHSPHNFEKCHSAPVRCQSTHFQSISPFIDRSI